MESELKIDQKLGKIEEDINNLKSIIINLIQKPKKNIKLKGLLKGISVSEKDIKEARKSMFKIGG